MNIRSYINISFLFLLCVAFSASAQGADVIDEKNNYGHELASDSITTKAQTRACVSSFSNQTVSSQISVEGCSTLNVQNVTVTNTGNLRLAAPNTITINGLFTVQSGGVLNMSIEQPQQTVFSFNYDASGNRIRRQ